MTNKIHTYMARRAFTLIETLLAIFILVTAIAGPLTIASKGLQSALIAKDQTTAIYLAQDGIEYLRYVRDTACLTGAPNGNCTGAIAFGSLLAACSSAVGCRIDSIQKTISNCTSDPVGVCLPLNYDTTNAWFTYAPTSGSIVPTLFTRTILVSLAPGRTDELEVKVRVSWNDLGNIIHTVTESENFYAWQ